MDTKSKDRKILNVGGSYLLTLPREFIEANGLKHGDKVGLVYNTILVVVNPRLPEEESDAEDGQL